MNERELRGLIGKVKAGKLSRRGFVQAMMAVGIGAPAAGQILLSSGVAMAQPASTYKPTKRGGGGPLKLLWWQGPTLLNPHFAVGTKDQDGSRLFYEPLRHGTRRQPQAQARGRDPDQGKRWPFRRRHVGHLETEAGRHLA